MVVDRLVEVIGQMPLELPHREAGTYSYDYRSYTQEQNTYMAFGDNIISEIITFGIKDSAMVNKISMPENPTIHGETFRQIIIKFH